MSTRRVKDRYTILSFSPSCPLGAATISRKPPIRITPNKSSSFCPFPPPFFSSGVESESFLFSLCLFQAAQSSFAQGLRHRGCCSSPASPFSPFLFSLAAFCSFALPDFPFSALVVPSPSHSESRPSGSRHPSARPPSFRRGRR